MSASREKKQRQNDGTATIQQQRQQKEAAEAKRKKIIIWSVAIVCVVAIVALLLWDSGMIQRNMTAATIGGEKISVAQMQYHYNSTRISEINYQQQYASYGLDLHTFGMLDENEVAYDITSSLGDEQVFNTATGETYAQHFKAETLESLQAVIALAQAAEAEGYTLSDSAKADLEEGLAQTRENMKANNTTLDATLKSNYGNYVTEKIYLDFLNRSALANDFATHYQNSLTYDEAALNAYAEENPANVYSYDYRIAFINGTAPSTTDADGNSVAATEEEQAKAKEAAKAKADTLADGVKNASGDKSEAFTSLVAEAVGSDSDYAKTETNTKTGILGSRLSSQPGGSACYSWLTNTERKTGDVEVIESGNSYYVVLMLQRYLDNTPTVAVRHILINAELPEDDPNTEADESAAPTQEQMDAAKAEAQRILDEYNAGEHTAEAFGALAAKYSADTGSASTGGRIRYIVPEDNYVQSFEDWALDAGRKVGDVDLVENNVTGNTYFGWHVMYFDGPDAPKWQSLADSALRNQDTSDWSKALTDACTVTESSNMALAMK